MCIEFSSPLPTYICLNEKEKEKEKETDRQKVGSLRSLSRSIKIDR